MSNSSSSVTGTVEIWLLFCTLLCGVVFLQWFIERVRVGVVVGVIVVAGGASCVSAGCREGVALPRPADVLLAVLVEWFVQAVPRGDGDLLGGMGHLLGTFSIFSLTSTSLHQEYDNHHHRYHHHDHHH